MKNYYVCSMYWIGTFNGIRAVFETLSEAKKYKKKVDKDHGNGHWYIRIEKIKELK